FRRVLFRSHQNEGGGKPHRQPVYGRRGHGQRRAHAEDRKERGRLFPKALRQVVDVDGEPLLHRCAPPAPPRAAAISIACFTALATAAEDCVAMVRPSMSTPTCSGSPAPRPANCSRKKLSVMASPRPGVSLWLSTATSRTVGPAGSSSTSTLTGPPYPVSSTRTAHAIRRPFSSFTRQASAGDTSTPSPSASRTRARYAGAAMPLPPAAAPPAPAPPEASSTSTVTPMAASSARADWETVSATPRVETVAPVIACTSSPARKGSERGFPANWARNQSSVILEPRPGVS